MIISLSISLNIGFGCSKKHLSEMVILIRPNKKISVFWVTGLKILHILFLLLLFFGKKNNFMHFERHFAFQNV